MFDFVNTLLLIFLVVAPILYLLFILAGLKKYLIDSKLVLFLLLLFVLVYFNKFLISGQTLSAQDFNNLQITFFDFFQKSALNYKLPPIWNSYTGGGYDAFSSPLSVYFSPFTWVFIIVKDVFVAANTFIILQVLLCSYLAYAFFRVLALKKWVALLGAVMFTYNAFLALRLSPGVGIEYLFTYKWVPALLAFTHLYAKEKKFKYIVLTGVSIGFLFEGNMNMAIATCVFWVCYVFLNYRFAYKSFVLAPVIGFMVYSIKLIPGAYLIATAAGRISANASGWRVSRIHFENILHYIFPLKKLYYTPSFTPGMIGAVLFVLALLWFILKYKETTKNRLVLNSILLFITGLILSTYNPVSELVFKLPLFNRLTILPAFLVFMIPTMVMITVLFLNKLEFKRKLSLVVLVLPLLMFAEVLLGPSTLGVNTYSFNFLKMDPKIEMDKLPYYNYLENTGKMSVILNDYNAFLFPSYNAVKDAYTLNGFKYLFGSVDIGETAKRHKLNEITKYADVIISPRVISSGVTKKAEFKIPLFLFANFNNYAILDRAIQYDNLQDFDWDHVLRIYTPTSTKIVSVKKTNSHPLKHSFIVSESNFEKTGEVITSITYSPFWYTNKGSIKNGKYGYLSLEGVKAGDNITLTYKNPFIYTGFVISFITLSLMNLYYLRYKKKLIRN